MEERFYVDFIDILGRRGSYGYFYDASTLLKDMDSFIKRGRVISVKIEEKSCKINCKYILSYRIEKV